MVILVFAVLILTVERMKLNKGRAKEGRVSSLEKLDEEKSFIEIMGKIGKRMMLSFYLNLIKKSIHLSAVLIFW